MTAADSIQAAFDTEDALARRRKLAAAVSAIDRAMAAIYDAEKACEAAGLGLEVGDRYVVGAALNAAWLKVSGVLALVRGRL